MNKRRLALYFVFFAILSLTIETAYADSQLTYAEINGQVLSTSNPIVTVSPGASLTGTIKVDLKDPCSFCVLPSVGINSWNRNYYSDLGGISGDNQWHAKQFTFSFTAPSNPGTYYIAVGYSGCYAAADVVYGCYGLGDSRRGQPGGGDDIWDTANWESMMPANQPSGAWRAIKVIVGVTPPPTYSFMLTSISPNPVTLGSNIIITGTITPSPQNGVTTYVHYTRPDGSTFTTTPVHNQQDFSSGFTVDYYKPDQPGTWSVYAEAYASGQLIGTSNSMTFTVQGTGFSVTTSPIQTGIYQGSSGTVTVSVSSSSQQSYAASLSLSGLPSGVSYSFSSQSGNPSFTSTLTLTVGSNAPAGDYTVTITGTGGGYTASKSFTLTIYQSQSFDFSISVSPNSGSVTAGSALTPAGTVTLNLISGSTQPVTLSLSGLPSNVGTHDLEGLPSDTCSPPCSISFGAGIYSSAPSGTYALTITGTGGGKTHSTTYTLVVGIPQPIDTTLPTISISSPSNGQSFTTNTITASGTASDNVALSKVEVKIGAGSWQLASGTTSWSKSVTLVSGSNTIYVRATDTSGNIAEATVTVSIPTTVPPTLAFKITNFALPSQEFSIGDEVIISASIRNEGAKDGTAFISIAILGPPISAGGVRSLPSNEPKHTEVLVKKGETVNIDFKWIVPKDVVPGVYFASIYVWDRSSNIITDQKLQQGPAFVIDTGVSYIQIERPVIQIPWYKDLDSRFVFIHIDGKDLEATGTTNFIQLLSVIQGAEVVTGSVNVGTGLVAEKIISGNVRKYFVGHVIPKALETSITSYDIADRQLTLDHKRDYNLQIIGLLKIAGTNLAYLFEAMPYPIDKSATPLWSVPVPIWTEVFDAEVPSLLIITLTTTPTPTVISTITTPTPTVTPTITIPVPTVRTPIYTPTPPSPLKKTSVEILVDEIVELNEGNTKIYTTPYRPIKVRVEGLEKPLSWLMPNKYEITVYPVYSNRAQDTRFGIEFPSGDPAETPEIRPGLLNWDGYQIVIRCTKIGGFLLWKNGNKAKITISS